MVLDIRLYSPRRNHLASLIDNACMYNNVLDNLRIEGSDVLATSLIEHGLCNRSRRHNPKNKVGGSVEHPWNRCTGWEFQNVLLLTNMPIFC